MVQRVPLHLGHIVAEYIRHQGQYARVGVIFCGPYITRLIIGIGLLDTIRGAERTMVPAPLSLETLRQMGLIRRHGERGYIMVMPQPQTITTEDSERTEGSQPALEAAEAPAGPEAPPTAPEPPPVRMFSLIRAYDRLERLESAVRGASDRVGRGSGHTCDTLH